VFGQGITTLFEKPANHEDGGASVSRVKIQASFILKGEVGRISMALVLEKSRGISEFRHGSTHSSVLAWRIPGTGEPGGLPSMGSHKVGHD